MFDAGAKKLGHHPFPSPHAILSQPYQGRPGCTYCGFCQAFGCHVGAKSSILVTKLPEADATGNFKLITGAMCYRVNSDNSGKVTGVSYYGPDGSDNTIEAEIVILAPFIYDNTRLLLLSKTAKFPNGLANSSGHVGKHIMAHIGARVFAAFDDRYVNVYMGPNAQKHTHRRFQRATISITPAWASCAARRSRSRPPTSKAARSAPRSPWSRPRACRAGARPIATSWRNTSRAMSRIGAQTENLPYADQTIDLDPDVRDPGACRRRASPMIGGGPTRWRASNLLHLRLDELDASHLVRPSPVIGHARRRQPPCIAYIGIEIDGLIGIGRFSVCPTIATWRA